MMFCEREGAPLIMMDLSASKPARVRRLPETIDISGHNYSVICCLGRFREQRKRSVCGGQGRSSWAEEEEESLAFNGWF